jgi:methylated-DNA-protein-cysteine methyltransferase-like protein
MPKAPNTTTNLSGRPLHKLLRRIARQSARPSQVRDSAFRQRILSVPKGKVVTYGQVAAAAGYPLYHRAVARLLRVTPSHILPWQRVVGAGGEIKLRVEAAAEQRLRLEMEGVRFIGRRVDLDAHQHVFGAWDSDLAEDLAMHLIETTRSR